ncbi:MAG: choice-of-anchor B family protein [Phycisphaerales bacterium]|nr:choice-of-anchor B family protein [Phycisphaerales bacterium]
MKIFSFIGALVLTCSFTGLVIAHEDDPKEQNQEPPFFGPIWRASDGGVAGGTFQYSGVNLQAWLPFTAISAAATSASDAWGYVSASGREYAILGMSNGTAFVEITVPSASVLTKFMPRPASASDSLWRNMKTYQNYCYAVSEGGGGIQVFDLAQIDSGMITDLGTVTTGGVASSHTMIINEATGFLYRMGGGSSGVRCYSLANPAVPTYVGAWSAKYTHDGAVFTWPTGPYAGREILLACGGLNGGQTETGLDILDITDKANIVVIGRATYPNAAYCHQGWISPDYKYFYINDEIDEANFGVLCQTKIIDIQNLAAPFLAGTYSNGQVSVDHNLYIKGNDLFASNYKSGLRIYDITNRTSPSERAWFDTYPTENATGYAGLWSNYPYFPSGTVIGSDIQRGLFVWTVGAAPLTIAYPQGIPTTVTPSGGSFNVTTTLGAGQTIAAGGAKLVFNTGGATNQTVPLQVTGAGAWKAAFPALACPSTVGFAVEFTLTGGTIVRDPVSGLRTASVNYGEIVDYTDSMEVGTAGWTVGTTGDNATSGIWERGDPVGTTAQPESDNTVAGVAAWITGLGVVGGSAGAADVDGGTTTLTSPTINATVIADPVFSCYVWYSNNLGGAPGLDSMPILLSNNGGTSWTQVDLVTASPAVWTEKRVRIADFMTPTTSMKLRFQARDLDSGSLVEAGVDDVRLIGFNCTVSRPADLNGDGIVNGSDLAVMLSQWGSAGSADITGDGTVGGADLAALLSDWG